MEIGGLLLTGGKSRRLGHPKSEVRVHGERLADRSARVLARACHPMFEIGPGVTDLVSVQEQPVEGGPLAALHAGAQALRAVAHDGPAVLLAVDLPFVDEPLLTWLAQHPAATSVIPRVEGVAQPVCARYAPDALAAAGAAIADGARSLHALLDRIDVTYLDEAEWGAVCDARAFTDIDTPEDLAAFEDLGWQ